MLKSHFVLYVKDQNRSTAFYTRVLGQEPSLHVPGMTEFQLAENCVLGLMPQAGIKRLLGARLPNLETDHAIARAELYLLVDEPQSYHQRALEAGAMELSGFAVRDWGHRAAYSLDPDGHVLAFAEAFDPAHEA
ncbi:MAG: VOC family protein [Chloroflexota bacterium]